MQNFRYYGLAFAVILIAELVTTGLQLLGGYFNAGHPVAILVSNLSGITLGGVIMVIGFLKDNRLDQERQRTEQERQRADAAEARLQEERERADRERERAEQFLAELLETRKENQGAIEARLRRLEERINGDASQADPD